MREYIKNQLLSLDLAQIEYYDTAGHYFFIPKYSKPAFVVNKMYLVEVEPELIDAKDKPLQRYLKIYVAEDGIDGLKVDAVGCNPITKENTNYFWSGWIKEKYLKQIAVL